MELQLVKPAPRIEEPDVTHIMECQAEFAKAFEVASTPEVKDLYLDLIDEEHEEWIEAYYTESLADYEELKELADLLYVTAGLAYHRGYDITKGMAYNVSTYSDDISDIVADVVGPDSNIKHVANLMYAIYGYADAMGWDINEAYHRVHLSNLSKLDDTGKPIRREDGKVLKGPNYKPPRLEDLTNYA